MIDLVNKSFVLAANDVLDNAAALQFQAESSCNLLSIGQVVRKPELIYCLYITNHARPECANFWAKRIVRPSVRKKWHNSVAEEVGLVIEEYLGILYYSTYGQNWWAYYE